MSFNGRIRPFVPPIIWKGLSRLKAKSRATRSGHKRNILDIASNESFSVSFIKVSQKRGTYFVPKYAEHRPASYAIISGGLYEDATHAFIDSMMMRKPGSMIHAGTFFGDMLPTFSRSCPGTVYAYEPVLENYILAKLCIEQNGLKNVLIQNAGLSDRIGIGHIDTGSEDQQHHGGSSRLSNLGQTVGLLTIDSLDIDDISIIQLDVEGHELNALNGARGTIDRCSPVIMIEDNTRSCAEFLGSCGYLLVGEIPGLFVWARSDDLELVLSAVSDLRC